LPLGGTAAVTRQLIEGMLIEMKRKPRNAQIIIQDSSENPTTLFFQLIKMV